MPPLKEWFLLLNEELFGLVNSINRYLFPNRTDSNLTILDGGTLVTCPTLQANLFGRDLVKKSTHASQKRSKSSLAGLKKPQPKFSLRELSQAIHLQRLQGLMAFLPRFSKTFRLLFCRNFLISIIAVYPFLSFQNRGNKPSSSLSKNQISRLTPLLVIVPSPWFQLLAKFLNVWFSSASLGGRKRKKFFTLICTVFCPVVPHWIVFRAWYFLLISLDRKKMGDCSFFGHQGSIWWSLGAGSSG